MRFDWAKFVEVAEHLAGGAAEVCDPDACYRSSVSRAYYGAFCMAKDFILRTDGVNCKGGGAHRDVQEHLKRKKGDKARRKIANQLIDLHYQRIIADYHDEWTGKFALHPTAKKSITVSRKILDELRSLKD